MADLHATVLDDDPQPRTRGRRQSALWRIGGRLDGRLRVLLAVAGIAFVLGAWALGAARADDSAVFPTPLASARALSDLWSDGSLRSAIWASSQRIRQRSLRCLLDSSSSPSWRAACRPGARRGSIRWRH